MPIRNYTATFLLGFCLLLFGSIFVSPASAKEVKFSVASGKAYDDEPVTYIYGIAMAGVCHDGTVVDGIHITGQDASDFQIAQDENGYDEDGISGHTLGPDSQISATIRFTPDPKKNGRQESAQLVVDTHGVDPRCKTQFAPCNLIGNVNGKVIAATPVKPPLVPQRGDIVIYRKANGEITHSGVIEEVDGRTVTLIISKWDQWGLYEHNPNDITPGYGKWSVYRSNRAGHNLLQRRTFYPGGEAHEAETDFFTDHIGANGKLDHPVCETGTMAAMKAHLSTIYSDYPSIEDAQEAIGSFLYNRLIKDEVKLPYHAELPTLSYNCHGYVFTNGQVWIGNTLTEPPTATVERILKENGYFPISAVDTNGVIHPTVAP